MEYITYHSTLEKNISDILKNGFKENFGKGFGSTFGNGIYTSPDIKYVSTYNIECDKILVCKIKPIKRPISAKIIKRIPTKPRFDTTRFGSK